MRTAVATLFVIWSAGVAFAQTPGASPQAYIGKKAAQIVVERARCSTAGVTSTLQQGKVPDVRNCPYDPVAQGFNNAKVTFSLDKPLHGAPAGYIANQNVEPGTALVELVRMRTRITLQLYDGVTQTSVPTTTPNPTTTPTTTSPTPAPSAPPPPPVSAVPPAPTVDLAVTAQPKFGTDPHPGDPVTYTVHIVNHGPNAATSVHVDEILAGLNTPKAGGACHALPCLIDIIPANGSVDVGFGAIVADAGRFDGVVMVSSRETDTDPSNNSAAISGEAVASGAPPTLVDGTPHGPPLWIWVLGGLALAGVGVAAAWSPVRHAAWSRAVTVTASLDRNIVAATSPIGFNGPALGIQVRLEPGDAGPKGPLPIRETPT